jgi:hypothetical protein
MTKNVVNMSTLKHRDSAMSASHRQEEHILDDEERLVEPLPKRAECG